MSEPCPSCRGQGKHPILCQPFVVDCPDCRATGAVPGGHAERVKAGAALKAARMAGGETLREFCKRTGESHSDRSRLERGFFYEQA